MSTIVPDALELEVLNDLLASAMTLKLYSNNVTPTGATTAAAFTEVTGGGYASKALTFANWSIVSGDPTTGTYNAVQTWTFTGATGGPGTIYGYYVTRDSDGKLMFAERFATTLVPFSPIAGSQIRVLPVFKAQSFN
jgi:hypothetical protein